MYKSKNHSKFSLKAHYYKQVTENLQKGEW